MVRFFCHTRKVHGWILSLCSASSRGISVMSSGVHANTSLLERRSSQSFSLSVFGRLATIVIVWSECASLITTCFTSSVPLALSGWHLFQNIASSINIDLVDLRCSYIRRYNKQVVTSVMFWDWVVFGECNPGKRYPSLFWVCSCDSNHVYLVFWLCINACFFIPFYLDVAYVFQPGRLGVLAVVVSLGSFGQYLVRSLLLTGVNILGEGRNMDLPSEVVSISEGDFISANLHHAGSGSLCTSIVPTKTVKWSSGSVVPSYSVLLGPPASLVTVVGSTSGSPGFLVAPVLGFEVDPLRL
uniref:Uncharacterized protein n=1 Tax=Tanacetum cinerariifolium TaxID=118510 RepID=A0A699JN47_TANCI|nr:hypothetical protein [Tanacetum cinerariifolium]